MLAPYATILDGKLDPSLEGARHITDPIAVGAVGGSGTRLIARILETLGVAMATPINDASDALEWPPMRRLLSAPMLDRFPRDTILRNAFGALERLLALRRHNLGLQGRTGWKVPSTHVWLAELAQFFPNMQYVHLLRNGLDMAYSGNQRQAQHWARSQAVTLELDEEGRISPGSMLEYWLSANEAALASGNQLLGKRMRVIRFEALCRQPQQVIRELADFLSIPLDNATAEQLASGIHVPASVDRYLHRDWQNDFTPAQLSRLNKLGYES